MTQIIPFHRPMQLSAEEKEIAFNKVNNCIATGMLTNRHNVRILEETIKDYYEAKHAIAVSSATQGLLLSLQSLLSSAGSVEQLNTKVHTQAFAWYSSKYAIKSSGGVCRYHDVDTDTWCMVQEQDKYYISLPVHTFGNISYIESEYTIYDGAHTLGSQLKELGDATVISLAPTKLITSIEGGIILTDSSNIAEKIKVLRDKTARMSEIHAIFGNVYLSHLEEVIKFKKEVFNYYKSNLNGVFQKTASSTNHNTIGMLTGLKIPDCIETKKYYQPLANIGELVNTNSIYKSIVCLPSWYNCPYKKIVEIINNYNK